MIKGRCVPIHGKKDCAGHAEETNERKPDCLYLTTCPKCGDPVYFLRHNGGSTWLDDIPYPWPKHPCFSCESAPVPPYWDGLHAQQGRSILDRIRVWREGSSALLMPADPRTKTWFSHLGEFRLVRRDSHPTSDLDGSLVLVRVIQSEIEGPPEFQATTSDGLDFRLLPHPDSVR